METAAVKLKHNIHSRSAISSNPYKIFIVEDSYPTRLMFENYIKKSPNVAEGKRRDYDIVSFENGEDCLNRLHEKPDIVVLDFYLDDGKGEIMNGLEVLKQIRLKSPSTKIIITSAQDSVIMAAEMFKQGASAYVSKEHACENLLEQAVSRLILQIEQEDREKNRQMLAVALIFILGILVGLLF